MRTCTILLWLLLQVACSRGWGNAPVRCHLDGVHIGSIESFDVDGRDRGVAFRRAPDVWEGSALRKQGDYLLLEENPIGVEKLVVEEHPSELKVRLAYERVLTDGGREAREDWLGCQRVAP